MSVMGLRRALAGINWKLPSAPDFATTVALIERAHALLRRLDDERRGMHAAHPRRWRKR
jgi:hypothetical protein